MTVSTTINKVSYTGNGVAVEFAVPFPFLDVSHLKVYQLLNDVQTERTDWTENNGNLVFETAPVSGAQIVIMREVPLTQETDYRENEILAAETLERNFDRLTMQVQQLEEKSARAVTVDVFDNTQAADLLPSIRQSVSNAALYAQTAQQQAQSASVSAQTAGEQAAVAANKAQETAIVLANKASVDADNFSLDGRTRIAAFALPDYSAAVVLEVTYAYADVPGAGFVYFGGNSAGDVLTDGIYLKISEEEELFFGTSPGNYAFGGLVPVFQNSQIKVGGPLDKVTTLIFFPLKGAQNA